MQPERTALLVIRAWRESASPVPLRAELRVARDVSAGFERRVTLTDADAVSEIVRQWLAELLTE